MREEEQIKSVEERAHQKADSWRRHLLEEIRVFEKHAKRRREDLSGVIEGHILDYFTTDIWGPATVAQAILQSSHQTQVAVGLDQAELSRLEFLYRLQSMDSLPYFPEKTRPIFADLIKLVESGEWKKVEDLIPILEEKETIQEKVNQDYGEALKIADIVWGEIKPSRKRGGF